MRREQRHGEQPPLVAEAARRVRAGMPPRGSYTILVSAGTGPAATATAAGLRTELGRDPRVRLSQVGFTPLEPVADPGTETGHVHAVGVDFDPWPDLVIRVSEVNGSPRVAAHPPGADPLRTPDDGWTWELQGP